MIPMKLRLALLTLALVFTVTPVAHAAPEYDDERLGHYSLSATASPRQVGAILAEVAKRDRLDALTTTETRGAKKRKATQRALGKKWRVTLRGEYIMAWKKAKFASRGPGALRQFGHVYADDGPDWWRDLYVYSRPLEHRATDTKLHWSDLHAAAGVQKGSDFKGGAQTRSWKRGLSGLGKWLRNIKVIRIVSGDWNVDLRSKLWRDRVEKRVGIKSSLGNRTIRWGTHRGRRHIDGFLVDRKPGVSKVVRVQRSKVDRKDIWDHVGTITTVRFYR